MRMRSAFRLALCCAALPCAALDRIDISADEVVRRDVHLRAVSVAARIGRDLSLAARVAGGTAAGLDLPLLAIDCDALKPAPTGGATCERASVGVGRTRATGSIRYDPASRLEAHFRVGESERWNATWHPQRAGFEARLEAVAVDPSRLAAWLPKTAPLPTKGRANVALDISASDSGSLSARVDAALTGLSFADGSALHAGENIDARFVGSLRGTAAKLDWQGRLNWQKGAVFWQPIYLEAGNSDVDLRGTYDQREVRIDRGQLNLTGVGKASFSGRFDPKHPAALDGTLRAADIDLAKLFALFAKPFYPGGALADMEMKGRGDVDVTARGGVPTRATVALRAAEIVDAKGRVAIGPIDARVPWDSAAATEGRIEIARAKLYGLPIGTIKTAVSASGREWRVADLVVPVFDGALHGQDLRLQSTSGGWRWEFQGGIVPISLSALTGALKWPQMPGTLSGVIPRVSFADNAIVIEGALLLKAFDGTIVVKDLRWSDPFGLAPRLDGTAEMRNLNLEMLTRTYSFGTMYGRIDADVAGLELVGWKPVRFTANVRSSPGRYEKRISQQAVQNISALGGAGAAAAVQRSVLRIFKDFGYKRVGLQCVLEGPVCRMSGIEDRASGYVIVEGGGIPAMTVMGYNRTVGWEELVTRLMRITNENAKPIIK